ncbi:histidine phosphatase family protein [Candidatus Pacearchaeota archaeon]|nr:histidine phosphatase family protein [Candidatus Pacearchaeota archaeon]
MRFYLIYPKFHMINLYLIRHAESELNEERYLISGVSNKIPLSKRGLLQAELLGNRFRDSGVFFDEVYSSTTIRALDTAKIVGKQLNYSLDDVVITPELLELSQGDWEGKVRAGVYTTEVLSLMECDYWNFSPPNGESQRNVEERMLRCINLIQIPENLKEITVGIFTHAKSIKCLLRAIIDFSPKKSYNLRVQNTSVTKLHYTNGKWNLDMFDDSSHLLRMEQI